ncbi:MAG: DUF433 domain-containing protein [Cyanobacteria bacterium J06621_11]
MAVTTESRYVRRHAEILSGEPVIDSTRIPVRVIVTLWRLGTPPEEIPAQYPQINLAQVFDALSFYLDNQTEINEYIERNRVPESIIHPAVRQALQTSE